MRKLLRLFLITVCLICPVGVLEAGPIINGSFELPTLGQGGWGLYTSIPGWAAIGDRPLEIGWCSVYGITGCDQNQVLELDSTGNAVAAQVVTTPGGSYNLSFLYAMRFRTAPATNAFQVYWNDTLVATITPTLTAMSRYSTTVTATAIGSDTLSFRGTGTQDSYGGMIDDVQLNTVPDGGTTLSMLGLGLVGLGCLRRRL